MKKIGTTALAVLTALSLTAFAVSCGEKKKETPKTPEKAPEKAPEKPADGGH
jgi:hypothetical protein